MICQLLYEINGNEYNGDEIISINGKKYQISGIKR